MANDYGNTLDPRYKKYFTKVCALVLVFVKIFFAFNI